MYEPPNRGGKTWNAMARVVGGPVYDYIVTSAASFALSYPVASLDMTLAKLTHRVRLDEAPVEIPATGWSYNAAGPVISLVGGNFRANDICGFSYTAKDPGVNGLGFAAVRDWSAWLRYVTHDDFGNANPMAGDIQRIDTETSSQPGRLLSDFRHLGFNQAENGRKAFDGLMQWIYAGSGLNLNYRFSQPNRTERNRQDHLHLKNRFPFANVMTTDPFTGKTDSRYARCETHPHLSAGGRDLFGQRVLGQVGLAAAHHTRRHGRPARLALCAQLPDVEHAPRHRQRRQPRPLPAVRQPAQFGAGAARAVHARSTTGQRQDAAAKPRAQARRPHAGAAAAAVRRRLSPTSRA